MLWLVHWWWYYATTTVASWYQSSYWSSYHCKVKDFYLLTNKEKNKIANCSSSIPCGFKIHLTGSLHDTVELVPSKSDSRSSMSPRILSRRGNCSKEHWILSHEKLGYHYLPSLYLLIWNKMSWIGSHMHNQHLQIFQYKTVNQNSIVGKKHPMNKIHL